MVDKSDWAEDAAFRRACGRLFVALDYPDLDAALRLAAILAPLGARFKVGLELFCRVGPQGVRQLQEITGPLFLDLKLHDIPRTVGRAVAAVARLGVWGVTLHATGGPVMLREAVDAARAAGEAAGGGGEDRRLRCLAVTVLTSMDEALLHRLGVRTSLREQVGVLAHLGLATGCDGVVASPAEARQLRDALGPDALIITPGVRPVGYPQGDQLRVDTAAVSVAEGADYLVVGRPVTAAADPEAAFHALAHEVRVAAACAR